MGCPQTNLIFSQISCLIVNVYLHLKSLLTVLRASRHSGDTCPGDNIVLILISSNLRKVTTIMDIGDKDHRSSSSAGCKDPSQGRFPQSHTDDSYILLYNTDYDGQVSFVEEADHHHPQMFWYKWWAEETGNNE